MSNMDVNQMLAQMRVMATQATGGTEPTQAGQAVQGADKPDFGKMLAESIESVSETQMEAGALKNAFEAGEPGAELPEVMVAVQKASLSFQAMTQVRNKLLSAYQEVMSMQV